MKKFNFNKKDIVHIIIIIIGIIFVGLSGFHNNLWFDEGYTVGIVTHSFREIWCIGANDVHPILYYWILHILYLAFGTNLIVYRLFSILCIAVLGILGFTHIRKDFGANVGMIFSYLVFFLPVMCIYAVEIRMYSMSALLAVIATIYAYRIIKDNSKKNWIIFGIFSLLLSYTHFYGLMTAGVLNLLLFIYCIKNKNKLLIKYFFIQAIIEVIIYMPWLVYFGLQRINNGGGFWVKLTFPGTLIEILNFQFKGFVDVNFTYSVLNIGTFLLAILVYVYLIHIAIREWKLKNDIKPCLFGICVYLLVIVGALIISFIIPILYSRYLFVITGVLIFVIAFLLSKEKNMIVLGCMIVLISFMSFINNYKLINDNYSETNFKQIDYLSENIEENDIIIYSNINESILKEFFPNNRQYFLNMDHWNIKEAYKAYAPQMEIVEDWSFLNNYKGRIWIIESEDSYLYKEISNIEILVEPKIFKTAYHDYNYNIMLVNKYN